MADAIAKEVIINGKRCTRSYEDIYKDYDFETGKLIHEKQAHGTEVWYDYTDEGTTVTAINSIGEKTITKYDINGIIISYESDYIVERTIYDKHGFPYTELIRK